MMAIAASRFVFSRLDYSRESNTIDRQLQRRKIEVQNNRASLKSEWNLVLWIPYILPFMIMILNLKAAVFAFLAQSKTTNRLVSASEGTVSSLCDWKSRVSMMSPKK